jgi:hypothetical protein
MQNEPTLTIVSGIGKESKKPYTALMLKIGDWTQMVFTKSSFETKYILKYAEDNGIEIVKLKDFNNEN